MKRVLLAIVQIFGYLCIAVGLTMTIFILSYLINIIG